MEMSNTGTGITWILEWLALWLAAWATGPTGPPSPEMVWLTAEVTTAHRRKSRKIFSKSRSKA